jgi:hypothetical protein
MFHKPLCDRTVPSIIQGCKYMAERSGAPTQGLRWAWTLSFGRHSHIVQDVLAVVIANAPTWEKARARRLDFAEFQ